MFISDGIAVIIKFEDVTEVEKRIYLQLLLWALLYKMEVREKETMFNL